MSEPASISAEPPAHVGERRPLGRPELLAPRPVADAQHTDRPAGGRQRQHLPVVRRGTVLHRPQPGVLGHDAGVRQAQHRGQLVDERLDGVRRTGRELEAAADAVDDGVRVASLAVEQPVHAGLHRVAAAGGDQRHDGDGGVGRAAVGRQHADEGDDRGVARQHRAGEQRQHDRAGQDQLDVEQPVAQHRDGDRRGHAQQREGEDHVRRPVGHEEGAAEAGQQADAAEHQPLQLRALGARRPPQALQQADQPQRHPEREGRPRAGEQQDVAPRGDAQRVADRAAGGVDRRVGEHPAGRREDQRHQDGAHDPPPARRGGSSVREQQEQQAQHHEVRHEAPRGEPRAGDRHRAGVALRVLAHRVLPGQQVRPDERGAEEDEPEPPGTRATQDDGAHDRVAAGEQDVAEVDRVQVGHPGQQRAVPQPGGQRRHERQQRECPGQRAGAARGGRLVWRRGSDARDRVRRGRRPHPRPLLRHAVDPRARHTPGGRTRWAAAAERSSSDTGHVPVRSWERSRSCPPPSGPSATDAITREAGTRRAGDGPTWLRNARPC